jgi:hypothetical protein
MKTAIRDLNVSGFSWALDEFEPDQIQATKWRRAPKSLK